MNTHRLERVIHGMHKEELKQILISSTPSIYYLTGLDIHPGERLLALILRDDGTVKLIANRLFALSGLTDGFELIEYDDTDDTIGVLSAAIKNEPLGVDKFWPSGFAVRLMDRCPDIRLRLGSAPVDEARRLKDAEEIRLLVESSRLNDRSTGPLIGMLNPGQTERDVARMYTELAREQGASAEGFALICFGKNCAEPHHNTDDTVLRHGDAVILDVGSSYHHYASDMTRTVVMGRATDEFKKVYDLVLRANRAAASIVRPGVPLKDIDRCARRVIEEAGYGEYFLHRTGHGIGIECHEPPDVSETSTAVAEPGMVFSIEPGIYLKERFGVRIEDLVAVTEDGCLVLNELERELIEVM